MIELASGARE